MTTSNTIQKDHITGFKKEISMAKNVSNDAFFTWFNDAKDTDASFLKGEEDFQAQIYSPVQTLFSPTSKEKVALEIGYGGGRLIAAASKYFKKVYGVDIHDEKILVENELIRRGVNNFELLTINGQSVSLPNECIDFVYSFIVLQHVEKIQIFDSYIKETFRLLKRGGVAILYFGRYTKYSHNKDSLIFYYIDRLIEIYKLKNKYKEIPARINDINLYVSLNYANRVARQNGFKISKTLISQKSINGNIGFGGQHGLVLIKK